MNKRQRKKLTRRFDRMIEDLAEAVRRAPAAHMTEAELIAAADQGKRERRARRRRDK